MHFPTHSRSRLIGAAAIACAAALIPVASIAATVSPSAAGSAAGPAVVPSCSTSGLVLWMDSPGDGAAGSIFYTLNFTNLSGHTCTIFGYPGVSAVGLGGAQIGAPAGRELPGPHTVTLANGATAVDVLQYSDVITGDNHCHAAAAGLRVYPPGQTASKIIPLPFTACHSASLVFMNVRPVKS